MVDIFRPSEYAARHCEPGDRPRRNRKMVWMQFRVRDDAAAKLAEDAGLKVVMNRCPKIEYGRLSSEISWIGVNSRTLSSKRAQTLGKGVQRMSIGQAEENKP